MPWMTDPVTGKPSVTVTLTSLTLTALLLVTAGYVTLAAWQGRDPSAGVISALLGPALLGVLGRKVAGFLAPAGTATDKPAPTDAQSEQ